MPVVCFAHVRAAVAADRKAEELVPRVVGVWRRDFWDFRHFDDELSCKCEMLESKLANIELLIALFGGGSFNALGMQVRYSDGIPRTEITESGAFGLYLRACNHRCLNTTVCCYHRPKSSYLDMHLWYENISCCREAYKDIALIEAQRGIDRTIIVYVDRGNSASSIV